MFSFLRIFSVISCLAVVLVALVAGITLRHMGSHTLTTRGEIIDNNIAQGYINTVWKKYPDVVPVLQNNDGKSNWKLTAFAQDTEHYFQKMVLARVNFYNAKGEVLLTVDITPWEKLSSIDVSPDGIFILHHLKWNSPISQLVHGVPLKNTPSATVVQSWVPLGDGIGMELVYNATSAWTNMMQLILYGMGIFIGLILVFFRLLFLAAQKAEVIIERQHEQNVALAAAAATAQAENLDKSQFLANVSHELRTPLNAIIGFSDIIKEEVAASLEKKYFDYINDINQAGVHLLSLINDILDYSKAEAGKLELEVSEVNAGKLIQNCMRLVSPRAETGQVKLVATLPKEPLTMLTDSKKFRQILLNLLSNAVKFTQSGGEVRVNAWLDTATDHYCFEVTDTGIGIALKDISLAMSPFGQVDNALSRKYEGTGLGLPLTKKFVELMGGSFTIESKVNVGTVITFTLPRELKARDGLIVKPVA